MSKHLTHIYPSLARPRRLVVSVGGSRWSPFRLTPPQSTLSPLLTLVLKRNYFPALLSWNNWINYLVIMFYFQLYSGVSGVGYPLSFHFSLLAKQTPCSYLQSLVCAEHIVPPSSVTSTALVNNMWANNAGSQHSTFNTFLPLSTPPTLDTGPFAARIIDTSFNVQLTYWFQSIISTFESLKAVSKINQHSFMENIKVMGKFLHSTVSKLILKALWFWEYLVVTC